ncbi:MAG: Bug family tripartite tricarboxylate transporter substrate binding protein, partial [Burkholderiales bacterium]
MPSYGKRSITPLCVTFALLAAPVLAQNYPTKPVRLIVGYSPGGPNDILARVVGQKLSDGLGVPVLVDNRPGADSMIGTQLTARATP